MSIDFKKIEAKLNNAVKEAFKGEENKSLKSMDLLKASNSLIVLALAEYHQQAQQSHQK